MRVIGIVGGIASGKSEVARRLAQRGAVVLNADELGHEVLCEPEVRQALEQRWGSEVFQRDGSVNRGAIAARVFGTTDQHAADLQFLEGLTHPRIRQRATVALQRFREQGVAAVVLDAALLFEKNWNQMCDLVVFVDAPQAQRRQRARQRGWSRAQFAAREAVQAPLPEKQARADWVFDNSRDLEHLQAQVDAWWNENFELATSR